MEALIHARCKTDKFHRIDHTPSVTTDPAYSEFGYNDMTPLERKKIFSTKLHKFMNYSKYFAFVRETLLPGADPGFSVGGVPTLRGGRQHTILSKFPKNCIKLRKFWAVGGGGQALPTT